MPRQQTAFHPLLGTDYTGKRNSAKQFLIKRSAFSSKPHRGFALTSHRHVLNVFAPCLAFPSTCR